MDILSIENTVYILYNNIVEEKKYDGQRYDKALQTTRMADCEH